MKILFILIFILSSTFFAFAQNLVENGSFENAWTCPESFTTYANAKPYPCWFNPSKGTPDQFHPCSLGDASVPFNFAGFMFPIDGVAYAGIILRETFDDSLKVYKGVSREYIQTKLTMPLEKEKLYCVKLSYANAKKSLFSVDALGVTLTNSKIGTKDAGLIIQRPQIINRPGHIMDNSENWIEMCGTYRAYGGEVYLTIGNFLDNSSTNYKTNNIVSTDSAFYYAYYYIDNVKVFEIENTFECGCTDDLSYGSDWMADDYDPETGYNTKKTDINLIVAETNNSNSLKDMTKNDSDINDNNSKNNADNFNNALENQNSNSDKDSLNLTGKTNINDNLLLLNMPKSEINEKAFEEAKVGSKFNLNRIFFEFNSSELLAISYIELDKLVEILLDKPNLRIEVRGHTDNIGTESYNRSLSIKRAQAVYEYLLNSGISKTRMKYRGFGTKVPVASNETDEGRRLNRRVEIVIVEI